MKSPRRLCEWCKGPIPAGKRADATTCSKRCRQAKARFKVRQAEVVAGARPMRFAYADPPYPGQAGLYPEREEVDHRRLVAGLVEEFPDGWALSTSARSTRDIWALCPAETRLCVWVNGPRPANSRRPLNAWEAVLLCGGRARVEASLPVEASPQALSDVLILHRNARQLSHPGALVGMKPAAFCEWVFRLLGALPGDELVDLYPGSGAVGRAWSLYTTGRSPGEAEEQLELAR